MALSQYERVDRFPRVLPHFGEEGHPAPAAPFPAPDVAPRSPMPGAEDMNRRIDAAYDEWKDADAASRALLRELREAWFRHDRGAGEGPSSELIGRAARLRHEASARLAGAIDLLHQAGLIQPAAARPSTRRRMGRLHSR